MKLLSREDFRKEVFKRDKGKCIVCGQPATAPHHIMDRSLWTDGGYYLDNGASLCDKDHLKAESCEISCETLRDLVQIEVAMLPDGFDLFRRYDKWGNIFVNDVLKLKLIKGICRRSEESD